MRPVAFLPLFALLGAACGDNGPWQGSERGRCYPNGTCDEGLVCLSDYCVRYPDASTPDANESPDADTTPDAHAPPPPDAMIDAGPFPDAHPPPDAQGGDPCNPVYQMGCEADEKCTWIVDVAGPPVLGHTGCAPDGDVSPGQACTSPETGADDCVAGYYCLGGECVEICTTAPDSCPPGSECSHYSGVLDDVANAGLCGPECDPVLQDCEDDAQACYLNAITGVSTCAAIPAGAIGRWQGDTCFGPDPGTCYVNGCDKGHGALLPDSVCAFFCNPIDNWLGNIQGLSGDPDGITCAETFGGARPNGPGPAYECRYIQSFYSNTEAVPASIGMCLNPDEYDGSCANFDLPQLELDIADGTADSPTYCADYPERCMFDCISLATRDALLALLPP